MMDLPRGLYEDLVTEALAKQLDDLDARKVPRTRQAIQAREEVLGVLHAGLISGRPGGVKGGAAPVACGGWPSHAPVRAARGAPPWYESRGSSVLLFARLRADDRAFRFLGPARYVSHESELPMAITWRLHHPLPADVFTSFAAAVA